MFSFIFFLCLPKERNKEKAPCRNRSACAGTPAHNRQSSRVGTIITGIIFLAARWFTTDSQELFFERAGYLTFFIGAVLRLAFPKVYGGIKLTRIRGAGGVP